MSKVRKVVKIIVLGIFLLQTVGCVGYSIAHSIPKPKLPREWFIKKDNATYEKRTERMESEQGFVTYDDIDNVTVTQENLDMKKE